MVALLDVRRETNIRHEHTGFARHVRTEIPHFHFVLRTIVYPPFSRLRPSSAGLALPSAPPTGRMRALTLRLEDRVKLYV
jgi:hypothetical protein